MTTKIELLKPHADLVATMHAMRGARYRVLVAGRRYSKTTWAEMELVEGAARGQRVAYFTPRYKYLGEMWRSLTSRLKSVIVHQNATDGLLQLIGGGSIEFWTMVDPDAGRSRKYHRIVIDEAGLLKKGELLQRWKLAIRPTLADYRGRALFTGSPKGFNDLYDLFQRGQKGTETYKSGYCSMQRPTSANPWIHADEIAEMRSDMTDLEAAQELDAQFVLFGGDLFPATWPIANTDTLGSPVVARVRFWDLAGADVRQGDHTVGARLALLRDRRVIIEDVARFQAKHNERNTRMRSIAASDGHSVHQVIEAPPGLGREASSGAALALSGYNVTEIAPRGTKIGRADGYISAAQGGRVFLTPAPWNRAFIEEHAAFPSGAHDDQIDAANGAFTWLQRPRPQQGIGGYSEWTG